MRDVVAQVPKSTTLSGTQCLCLDFDGRCTVFSSMLTNSSSISMDAWAVWASVPREFRTAWALPFARSNLSRPYGTTVHASNVSLSGMGVAAVSAPLTVVRISERWRFKGPMRAPLKPRGACDEEVGPSDRDLLSLADYQARCLGTRAASELYAAKDWRVLCARRWRRPERIVGLECEGALWTVRTICRKRLSRKRQHLVLSDRMSWVCAATKGRSSIWSLARRTSELCGLCLASKTRVRYRGFLSECNPADEPS